MTGIGFSASWHGVAVVALLVGASTAGPAFAADRHVIELQVRVRTMSDQAMIMQQSIDESFGAMSQSLGQSSARLAASAEKLARLQRALHATSIGAHSGSLSRQMQGLTQSTRDLVARMHEIQDRVQILNTEIGQPAQAVVGAGEALPPNILFRNGLEDYESGNYKLANKEFAEYLKFYSGEDQAAQAQFYLADCEYWAGNYQQAVRDFDKLEQNYPNTKPATVELKKGLSLMKLGQPEAARQQLRWLVERYPNSVDAMEARSELGKLQMEARIVPEFPKP
jgi:TolA-binding protein